jgi:hypothetical protein
MPIKDKSTKRKANYMIKGKISGINQSNTAQMRKIEKLEITKEKPKVPTSDFYMYVDSKWVHKGLACRLCGLILGNQTVQDKHQYICKVLNKKTEDE